MEILRAIWSARTRIVGWLTVVTSAAYIGLPVLQSVVSTRTFAISTFILGIVTASIGHFNRAAQKELESVANFKRGFSSLKDTHTPEEHAAADNSGDNQVGQ